MIPTDADLDRFRLVGDPLADAVVELLTERHGTRLPGDMIAAVEALALDGEGAAVAFWEHVHHVPTWVDFECMRPAFEVALRNALPSGLALMAGSLVESYASSRGARVLVRTGRLRTDTWTRLFETAKFASDLALHRGARPGNTAWRSVVGVRLLHARVRRWLARSPEWNTELWGAPINQEDYAGTLFMFSCVYRRGLERLGVELDDEEQRGGHHNWRWTGHLLGIDERLLTRDRDEEFALYGRMRRRNYDPDDDSRALAHGLLSAMAGRPPFFLPLGGLYAISRRLIGDELADALDFPTRGAWDQLVESGRFLGLLSSRAAARGGRWSVRAGERFTEAIVRYGLPGETAF